jgi:hypothetical protein
MNDIKKIGVSYGGLNKAMRTPNDILYKFEAFKNVIPKEDEVVIKGMTTVYGLHSSDVNELVYIAEDMIASSDLINNTPFMYLYDPKTTQLSYNDLYQYKILKHLIANFKINIRFLHFKIGNERIYIPTYTYFSGLMYEYKNLLKLMPDNLKPIAIRHFSSLAIQHFSQDNSINTAILCIKYPVEKLALPNFTIQQITTKIHVFYLKPEQIILDISADHINPDQFDFILENIKRLKANGYKIALSNVTVDNIDLVKLINPYVCFYKNIVSQDLNKSNQYDKLMRELLTKENLKFLI